MDLFSDNSIRKMDYGRRTRNLEGLSVILENRCHSQSHLLPVKFILLIFVNQLQRSI